MSQLFYFSRSGIKYQEFFRIFFHNFSEASDFSVPNTNVPLGHSGRTSGEKERRLIEEEVKDTLPSPK